MKKMIMKKTKTKSTTKMYNNTMYKKNKQCKKSRQFTKYVYTYLQLEY